jgi:hypothetical protein
MPSSSALRLDVGDEAPLEARDQALLHLGDLLRVDVARHDDLPIRVIERVERVEELFLRLLAAREELDVVHQQDVAVVAVAVAELVDAVVLQRPDELVREALGREVEHARVRVVLEHAVPDGVHEVGLAEPDAAVDEERVVALAPRRRAGHRGGVRELVRGADDVVGEAVAGIQAARGTRWRACAEGRRVRRSVRARARCVRRRYGDGAHAAAPRARQVAGGCVSRRGGDLRRGERRDGFARGLRTFLERLDDDPAHLQRPGVACTARRREGLAQHVEVVRAEPLTEETVGDVQRERVALDPAEAQRGEPGLEVLRRQAPAQLVECLVPEVAVPNRHRRNPHGCCG